MTVATPDELHAAALAALDAIPNLNVFDGAVGEAGQPEPPTDPDGGVHMFAVLHTTPTGRASENLGGAVDRHRWAFQVTCAGGSPDRALRAAGKVLDALTGTRLTPDSDPVTEVLDTPPPPHREPDPKPARWSIPLLFAVNTVTAPPP